MTPAFWKDRRVLVTGHTGFKGAWLCLWLTRMGAKVSGLALEPDTDPNLWTLLGLKNVQSHICDINDASAVATCLAQEKPEIVLHLAAQPLVRRSYREPIETFATNVMGVVTLLDAIRQAPSVQSCVIVTSDKCYRNDEQVQRFGENDPMGGLDPYSASKGAAELVTTSMRHSFFAPYAAGGHPARIASARAGNVIGGGDWSEDRLIPDILRGCLGPDGRVVIRAPNSVRPWQHVLEPLRGYLMLAEHLTDKTPGADDGWNFGPDEGDTRPVIDVANAVVGALGQGQIDIQEDPNAPHEAKLLQLDSSKARQIGWAPGLDFSQTVEMTAGWYGGWSSGTSARDLCGAQIEQYMQIFGERL